MSPDPSSPEIEIDFAEPAPPWREALPEAEALCSAAVRAALREAAPGLAAVELAIVLAADEAVRALNRHWRGQDKPTNVLSFPVAQAPEGPRLLGDVILAYETVAHEAKEHNKSLADHVSHLVVHGTLHLLGHDHEKEDDAERMEHLERRILAMLGVADPYRVAEHG